MELTGRVDPSGGHVAEPGLGKGWGPSPRATINAPSQFSRDNHGPNAPSPTRASLVYDPDAVGNHISLTPALVRWKRGGPLEKKKY